MQGFRRKEQGRGWKDEGSWREEKESGKREGREREGRGGDRRTGSILHRKILDPPGMLVAVKFHGFAFT